jgi:hypothetical protein
MEGNENETGGISKMHADHRAEMFPMNNWRAWGSWFSWGSPVGLGIGWTLFIIPVGIFLWLLHLANIIH